MVSEALTHSSASGGLPAANEGPRQQALTAGGVYPGSPSGYQ
jgi:hypothetical protein